MVAMAFKLVEDPYGTLTFMRLYQGPLSKGGYLRQSADRPQGTLQPHPSDARRPREDIDEASAATSWPCLALARASGDTYASEYPYARWRACSCPNRSSR